MSSRTPMKINKAASQTIVPSRRLTSQYRLSFSPHENQRPASWNRTAYESAAEPGFTHDFSLIRVHPEPNTTQRPAETCSLGRTSPRSCPFGGVCHSCPPRVHAKLTVGQPNDRFEREADRVAEQVMRMPDPRCPECEEEEGTVRTRPLATELSPFVQRQVEPEEEEEEEILQAKALSGQTVPFVQRQVDPDEAEEELIQPRRADAQAAQPGPNLETRIRSLKGDGQPLPHSARSFFEPRFGRDFGNVRVHTDEKAAELASSVRAKAFTFGRDVVFGSARYAPDESAGRRLLAHELGHVVQQTASRAEVRRAWIPDTGWRYTPPASVTRSIVEIQGIVGTTPDGIYGPNTREAVRDYQRELRDNGLYAGDIDGKWGPLTEAGHISFAIDGIGPTAPRRGYNCAGFAFKTFTWHDLAPTRAILSTMTSLSDCSDNCNARDYKFWLWECDVSVTAPDGSTTPTHRDFHIVGGQTGRNGEGPDQVMSKNGQRPVEGPRPPLDWMPASGTAIDQDGNPMPGYAWNISNVDEECYCNDELP